MREINWPGEYSTLDYFLFGTQNGGNMNEKKPRKKRKQRKQQKHKGRKPKNKGILFSARI
jgi:hypothetical protein